jgi:phosphoglycolate phosphatase-like HAD superfamily hydrolase
VSDLLVLWDLDGTLLNAGGVGAELYRVVFLQLFGRPLEAFAPMAGRTDRAIILETLELAGVPEPWRHVDRFIAGLTAHAPAARAAVAARGRALPGAAAALAALGALATGGAPTAGRACRVRRVRQSVLTGNIRPMAAAKLAALGLDGPLDLRIGAYGDDHEVRAELVGVARHRAADAGTRGRSAADFAGRATVLVGDTPLDIEAALATGARAVGVATGPFPAADLRAAGAHAVLPDLTDTGLVMRAVLSLGRPPAAGHAGEQGLSRPVQPRLRSEFATCAAVAQRARVMSSQPYRSVDPPSAVAALSRLLSAPRRSSGWACFPSSSISRPNPA